MIHGIGSGGVGFWLYPALARAGVDLTVYDNDTLEGGLGYTRLPQAALGTYKVDLLLGFCRAVMGTEKFAIYKRKFEGWEASRGDLVVDCSDMDLEARRKIYDAVKHCGARYLRVSYDGLNETVVVAEGIPLKGRKGGGYAEKPNLALSFMAGGIGALAVQRILKGWEEHVEFQVSLADYFGTAQHVVEVDLTTLTQGIPVSIPALEAPEGVLVAQPMAEPAPKRKRVRKVA